MNRLTLKQQRLITIAIEQALSSVRYLVLITRENLKDPQSTARTTSLLKELRVLEPEKK